MPFLSGTIRTSVQSDRVIHAITIATNDAIVYRVEEYIAPSAEGAFQSKRQTCVAAIVFYSF